MLAVTVDWRLEQLIVWSVVCAAYLAVSYLRWCTLPKMKLQPAKQFRVFMCALLLGLMPSLLVYMQKPFYPIIFSGVIAVLGVLCLLQLAPSYATPGYDFEAADNLK